MRDFGGFGYRLSAGCGAVLLALSGCGDEGDTIVYVQAGGTLGAGGDGGSSGSGGSGEGASAGDDSAGGSNSSGGSNAAGGSSAGSVGTGGSAGSIGSCVASTLEVPWSRRPVDLLLVVDNSGSMAEEMPSIEAAVHEGLVPSLVASGLDYRVILISRHRRDAFEASEEASTSICISSPLSGLATCPAEAPLFAERFYQYGDKVESLDVYDMILSGYNMPDTRFDLAPLGYSEWLRIEATKVFVAVTDDDEDMPAATFISSLTALSGQHFGNAAQPSFTFHSIAGVGEKVDPAAPYLPNEPVQLAMCTGNASDVVNASPTHQELSILTSGLRFPICQFPALGQMFGVIVEDMVLKAAPACDSEIPDPPSGTTLDPNQATLTIVPSSGEPQTLARVAGAAECEAGAFYLDAERVYLCPESCSTLQSLPGARLRLTFACADP